MSDLDHTHDPKARSWVESANDPATDFPIQNLPFGVFSRAKGEKPRVGTRIGDFVLDLDVLERQVGDDVAGVVVANPNVFGVVEDVAAVVEAAHTVGALVIAVVDPVSLGLLQRPGDAGADIVVGEAQSLGGAGDLPVVTFESRQDEGSER